MNWFDLAYGNEKIRFIFNNELSLEDVEIRKLVFNDISSIRLFFVIRNIPKIIPEKWKKRDFNSIYLTLTCIGIHESILQGTNMGFRCSPVLTKINDGVQITIDNKDGFHLSCIADLFDIESIETHSNVE